MSTLDSINIADIARDLPYDDLLRHFTIHHIASRECTVDEVIDGRAEVICRREAKLRAEILKRMAKP